MTRVRRALGWVVDRTLGAAVAERAESHGASGVMPRWALVGGFWIVQALAVTVMSPLVFLVGMSSDVGGEWMRLLIEPEYWLVMAIALGVVTLMQAVLLWPVRRPGSSGRGWPLALSAAVAGAMGSLLLGAMVLVVADAAWLIEEATPVEWGMTESTLEMVGRPMMWVCVGGSWLVMTPLIWVFVRRGERETALSRVASQVFMGTVIEAAAVVPIDVMIRRKQDCYCEHGTMWALVVCIGVGTVAAGPAAWLPMLARRRKRWYRHRCGACGYDMRGSLKAERCPECGCGWRAGRGRRSGAGEAGDSSVNNEGRREHTG
ncbi:MAG: hypothetical protein AB7K52_00945 [Phycisphaerales bacterium]